MPIYKTLRDHDPATFRRAVDEILVGAQKGDDLESTINAIRRKAIEPLFTANAKYLPDEAMVRYANLIVSQMQVFEGRQPELCVRALRGQPLGDIRPYLSESLIAEELMLLDEAIRVDRSNPKPRYSQAEQDKLVEAVVVKLAEIHGEDIRLLEPTANVLGHEPKTCRLGADFFREIAALPAEKAAAFLRSILDASGQ